ncbi:FkbM family methyltransferase [Anoxybacterium hadale]|uniref:FkbM family methyltransferase n=1 Tax=Anoxybacterium hadale TaxID=3408580 RepID=A0ACD1A8Z6_9FIRM|nr:FkbM family methyltransferase [Clostridiales bacterium]
MIDKSTSPLKERIMMTTQTSPLEPEAQTKTDLGYPIQNERISIQVDKYFGRLMEFIGQRNLDGVKDAIKQNLLHQKITDPSSYMAIVNYYNRFSSLWGGYDPDNGIFDLIDNRADALLNHKQDFEWLYSRLGDYRSKKILLNILSYWLKTDKALIGSICDKCFSQYFDFDLIHCDANEVFVDVGAYIGDSLVEFTNMYGRACYKKIYCYEVVPANVERIRENVEAFRLKNVEIKSKGVGEKNGVLYLAEDGISSVNQLSQSGSIEIPTVAIDEDIEGPVTFIKMDIEGAEEQALMGCLKKIKEYHPKLALSAYHNHKDLWKLARIIEDTDPSYQFYLRYYGYGMLPTEYVLFAI